MYSQHSSSGSWHWIRSLLPSLASAFLCLIGAISFVAGCTFLDSVSYGTILPSLADGEPATIYTNKVVQPIETAIHSVIWNNVVSMLIWGLVGVCVYELFSLLVELLRNWRDTHNDIQFINRRVIIRHPLEKSFIFRFLWRFGITIAAFISILLLQPLLHNLFQDIHAIITANSSTVILRNFLWATAVWALLLHAVVVFLRLYTLRTRLFGDTTVYEQ